MVKSSANEKVIGLLIENQPDAIVWFAPIFDNQASKSNVVVDFAVQYYNRAAAQVFNLIPFEDKELLLSGLMNDIPSKHFFEYGLQVWEKGDAEEFTFYSDVHDRYLNVQISRVESGILSVTRDRTKEIKAELEKENQAKEQQGLLNNILKHSANGISVTQVIRDPEGKVIDGRTILANDAAVRYTGIPREIYLSKRALELDPNISESLYFQMCIKTLETGEPQLTQYYLDLTQRWLEVTVSRLDDEHLITIFTDVSPIKEGQLKQQKLMEELKRSNQSLEEFVYAASHDLKEPIRKIHFFTEQLKERLKEQMDESHIRILQRVENSAKRMGLLVDDLLEYSHVSRGMENIEEVDLNHKLQVVLEELELIIHEKRAYIEVGPLPTIKGLKRQMQQLFQNLIANALKYSKPNITPHITIRSSIVTGAQFKFPSFSIEPHQQFYLIEVKDNGIGFAPEHAERIFNVFTRLHGNTEYTGNGVGLSIARKVAENHGGHIWAESELGNGATFKVLLPAE